MEDVQIIKEKCKEMLHLKLRLRFLEIISNMSSMHKSPCLSGIGLLSKMRQACTRVCAEWDL